MKSENLSAFSNEQLAQKIKEIKNGKLINAAIIGFTFGICFYGVVKNSFGFFTFFPLIIAYLIVRNSKNNKILEIELQKELQSRNVK